MPEGPPPPDGFFRVKNWEKFQHYKKRNPPWIRLYNELLDDYSFNRLPDASKWHAVGIWLLASRFDNRIPADPIWVQQRIGAREPVDLSILVSAGFIEGYGDASALLAERTQDAPLEGEGEGETETTTVDKSTEAVASLDEVDLAALDVSTDTDWYKLQRTLFAPLREHVWGGRRPPPNVPHNGRKWDEARELSYIRDWIRGDLLRPDEATAFLEHAPTFMQWKRPASLSWLGRDEHIPRIREIVGELRKDQMTNLGEVPRAS